MPLPARYRVAFSPDVRPKIIPRRAWLIILARNERQEPFAPPALRPRLSDFIGELSVPAATVGGLDLTGQRALPSDFQVRSFHAAEIALVWRGNIPVRSPLTMEETLSHTYRCLCGGGMRTDEFTAGRLAHCSRCDDFVIVPRRRGDLAKKPGFSLRPSRLTLDLARPVQWRDVHAVRADKRNYDFEISAPATEKQTKKYVKQSSYPSGLKKLNHLLYRAARVEDGFCVGVVYVTFSIRYYCADLGFMIHRDHQGNGYGTEAVSAICDFLLCDLGVEKVTSMCDSKNRACRSLLERVGFTQEGLLKRFYHHPQRGWIDSPYYALFRENRFRAKPAQ